MDDGYPAEVKTDQDKYMYDIGWTEAAVNLYEIFESFKVNNPNNTLEAFDNFMAVTVLKAHGASVDDMISVAALRNDPELVSILERYKNDG
jgi:hypothetical protein